MLSKGTAQLDMDMVNKATILNKTKTITTTKDSNTIIIKISSPDPMKGEISKEVTIDNLKDTTKKLVQETITIGLDNKAIEKKTILKEDTIITIIIPRDQTFLKRNFYKTRPSNILLISW